LIVVKVAGMCEALHVLPDPGGLLDQDPYWVDRIALFLEIRESVRQEEEKRNARNV
jgi:hypothetical protein